MSNLSPAQRVLLALGSVLLLAALLLAVPAHAQEHPPVNIDRATLQEWSGKEFTWRATGGSTHAARVSVYGNTSRYDQEERPFSVVLFLDPANGYPASRDAAFIAETVARQLGVDPVRLAFLFRFELAGSTSPLTLRATFRRRAAGGLGSPSWRALGPEEVEDYTDRQLR